MVGVHSLVGGLHKTWEKHLEGLGVIPFKGFTQNSQTFFKVVFIHSVKNFCHKYTVL
jgi:hypothetical protein